MPTADEAKCRGTLFIANAAYVKRIGGDDGLAKVESSLTKRWPGFRFASVGEKDWLPLKMRVDFLETCKSELGWDDRRIFQMGEESVKYSFIVQFLMNYFMTIQKALAHGPEIWEQNYRAGHIKVLENTKDRGRLAIYDFKFSPILCTYLAGYFHGVGMKIAKAKSLDVIEEKCAHKGADHCEFVFKWTS
jgi:predicted hydrocarbon binding protein